MMNKIIAMDIREVVASKYIDWNYYRNSKILITGANGLIGSQIIKVLLHADLEFNLGIEILALVRNKKKIDEVLPKAGKKIKVIVQDITKRIKYKGDIDFIIHAASVTSSKDITEKPVETINSIVLGTENVLEFAKEKNVKSIVYLSSMEVYGSVPFSRKEPIKEKDFGYIDIFKSRSSYPEGKRMAEALCAAYWNEYKLPVKIARLAQTIGASLDYYNQKVFAEFARSVVEEKNIVLKTQGESIRSYIYITDVIVALLIMLKNGENGEEYNIANTVTTCSIKDVAKMLCDKYVKTNLVVEIDDKYYPEPSKYELDTLKFQNITGWEPNVSLEEMFSRLVSSFCYQKISMNDVQKNTSNIKKFIQRIFSIRNSKTSKIITFLGIKFTLNKTKIYKKLYQNSSVKNNRIIFNNFNGKGYGCHPKYIAEEIIRRKLPYDMYWLCENEDILNNGDIPTNIKKVIYKSKEAIRLLYSAKVLVSNVRCVKLLKRGWEKTDNQVYIQTWHGSLGIKKIGHSIEAKTFPATVEHGDSSYDEELTKWDFLISNSEFENNVYKEALKWDKETLMFGHPRNDIFFVDECKKKQIRNKILSFYGLDTNSKIILYAPSYRYNNNIQSYQLDYENVLKNLKNRFQGKWVAMLRLHPRLVKSNLAKQFLLSLTDVVDASCYPDMQELMVSADALITDYSSCIFDFMLSEKPAFIFATDINEYNNERGFYYPLETTPFPIAKTNDELAQNILKFDMDKYSLEVEQFLKDKGCMEDGLASKRVVDLIEKIMRNGNEN